MTYTAGSGRPQWPLQKLLKPIKKQVIGPFSLTLENLVSADSAEVKQLPSWLQLIEPPTSCTLNTIEQPKATTPSEPDHPKPEICGIRDIFAGQRPQDTKKNLPQHLENLRACESLEDLRRTATNLDGQLRSRLEFSESAFRRVLRSGCGLETFLQFLSDPSLNLQKARNLPRLWEWYISEPRNRGDSIRLHNWLRRHISLGMQSKRELQDLIEVALYSSRDTSKIQQDRDLHRTILDGLNLSGVDQISDLGGEILNQLLLLVSLNHSWQNPGLQTLSFKIFEVCKPDQLHKMAKGISCLLTSYLVSASSDREVCSHDGQVSKVLDYLLLISEIEASKAIASASQALLMRLRSSHSTWHLSKRNADQWWSLLLHHKIFEFIKYRSEWLRIERALAGHDTEVLCMYLKHISDDEKCTFLLRHWFIQYLEDGDNLSPSKVSYAIELFNNRLVSRKGQKCPFIFLFKYLPPRVTADKIVLLRLFSLLNKLELQEISLKLYSYFLQLSTSVDFGALAKDIIDFTSPTSQAACTLFKITPFLPLESCPSVAETMILNPDDGLGVPLGFRVLRRKSLGVSNVYPHTAEEIRCAQIELLNRMAMAYAQASHLYPRVAFRQVYQCYRLLVRRHGRASLSMAFSRAFTLAGLINPLQKVRWVGMTQLKFVLRIIKEIEGDEVASKVDELLYIWRNQLIGEKANEALALRLRQKLGFLPPEERKPHTHLEMMMIEAIRCEETRQAKVASHVAGKPRGKLPGESNGDQLVRERTARDVKFALAAQRVALEKYNIRPRAWMKVLRRLGEDTKAREMANSLHKIPARSKASAID